jgi:hypothetical protein
VLILLNFLAFCFRREYANHISAAAFKTAKRRDVAICKATSAASGGQIITPMNSQS